MELARILLLGSFFFFAGVTAGIVLSSNYCEQISVAVARYGGYAVIFLSFLGFVAGVFAERVKKRRFTPLTVGKAEQVGMDVVKAVNASLKRAGIRKVVER